MNRKHMNWLSTSLCVVFFALAPCFAHAELHVQMPVEMVTDDDIDRILAAANPFNAKLVYQTMARITNPSALSERYGNLLPPSPDLQKLIADGFRKMEQEDFSGAIGPLAEAAKLAPRSEGLLYSLGKSLLFSGRDQEAEAVLKSALQLVPWRSTTWTALALSLANQGKSDAAISALVLAYEWSLNKQETIATFKHTAGHTQSEVLRALYHSALSGIERRMEELELARSELAAYEAARTETSPSGLADEEYVPVEYLEKAGITYPDSSRRHGEQGTTLLALLVDNEGRTANVIVKSSSGYANLDHAGQIAMWTWRFRPARKGGEAVTAWVTVPIVWKLE